MLPSPAEKPVEPSPAAPLAVEVTPPAAAADPDWLQEHPLVKEVRSYLRTFAAFALRPRRFAREWLEDGSRYTNPLTFLVLSAGGVSAASKVFEAFVEDGEKVSGWVTVARSLGPYAYYVAVALLCHALLLPARSGRRWTSSVAMALFAGGLATLLVQGVVRLIALGLLFTGGATRSGSDILIQSAPGLLLMMTPLIGFYVSLGGALAGVHRVRAWIAALLMLGPFVATSFVSNWVPLPVAHLQVGYERVDDTTHLKLYMTSGTL